jgi:hypothetical protein
MYEGFTGVGPTGHLCSKCGARGVHFMKYDRIACFRCNVWLDKPCMCGPEDGCPFERAPEWPHEVPEVLREDGKQVFWLSNPGPKRKTA